MTSGALILGVVIAAAPAASAAVLSTIDVVVPGDAPTVPKAFGNSCNQAWNSPPVHYVSYPLKISAAGAYTYTDKRTGGQFTDISVAVYPAGGFDPSNQFANCLSSGDETSTFNFPSAGTYRVVVTGYDSILYGPARFTLLGPGVAALGSDDIGGNDADAPPIPMWVQSVGRTNKDATCDDGWDPSWQEWAQPVTGGWVCTRSIPSLG